VRAANSLSPGRTLRPVSAAVGFWLAVAVGGWAALDAVLVEGLEGTRLAAVILLVLWVLWVLLWLPSIRIRENEIVVVNALRTWTRSTTVAPSRPGAPRSPAGHRGIHDRTRGSSCSRTARSQPGCTPPSSAALRGGALPSPPSRSSIWS
jgi:hypothetical protein